MRHDRDDEAGDDATSSVPLAEETVSVGRRDVVTGRIRVTTRVETREELVEADLADEEVEVVRVPVGRVVDAIPAIRSEGDVTIVPVVEEVAVVEVRLVLREELHLHRRTQRRTVSVPVSLRRQRADIVREPVSAAGEGARQLPDACADPAPEPPPPRDAPDPVAGSSSKP